MVKVVLDAATRAKLNRPNGVTQLCDESGAVLGYCLSPKLYSSLTMPVEPPFTDAEIEEAFSQLGPGRPLADILADLGKR